MLKSYLSRHWTTLQANLHNSPKHTMFYKWGMLYPLYVIAEGEYSSHNRNLIYLNPPIPPAGIIFTDLAELLGTAIAFNL